MEASTWHVRLIDYIHRGVITKYISAVHDTWLVSIKMEKESGPDLNKNLPKIFEKNVHRIWEGTFEKRIDSTKETYKNFDRDLFIVDGNGARPLALFLSHRRILFLSFFPLSLALTSDKLLVI